MIYGQILINNDIMFSFFTWYEKKDEWTRCVCKTQMPPIMGNSKDGKGHKDKNLDTSVVTWNTYVI